MHLLTSSTIVALWTLYSVNGFPTDNVQTAVEGQSALLRCSRTQHPDRPVDWKYKEGVDVDICLDGRVVDKFRDRYELDDTDYTLTILIVTTRDAGVYECIENNGLGDSHAVRLQVLPPPPGQLSLVDRTETSLVIRFNQTGVVTDYKVSVNGRLTVASDFNVTYSAIGQEVVTVTLTVDKLIPGSRHSVDILSSRNGVNSKTSTTANYSTVPAAPGPLQLMTHNYTCLAIIWNQTGQVVSYTAMLNSRAAQNVKYFGVGTGSVAAVFCDLSDGMKYNVSITAVGDGVNQTTSGDFATRGLPIHLGGFIFFFCVFIVGIIAALIVIWYITADRRNTRGYPTSTTVLISLVLLTLAGLLTIVASLIITFDFFWYYQVQAGNAIFLMCCVLAMIACGFYFARSYYRTCRNEDFLRLTPKQKSFIDTNKSRLSEEIAVKLSELVEQLQRREWITDADRRRMESVQPADARVAEVGELLNELKYSRRPMFKIFIECLEEIGLNQLASIITAGEGELKPGDIGIAPSKAPGQDDPTGLLIAR